MPVDVFRFRLASDVPLEEAEMTLQLATFAAEGLFGQARVRLDFSYHIDQPRNVILVDGTTEVGSTVVQIFVGLLLREFGDESFQVERLSQSGHPEPHEVAA